MIEYFNQFKFLAIGNIIFDLMITLLLIAKKLFNFY